MGARSLIDSAVAGRALLQNFCYTNCELLLRVCLFHFLRFYFVCYTVRYSPEMIWYAPWEFFRDRVASTEPCEARFCFWSGPSLSRVVNGTALRLALFGYSAEMLESSIDWRSRKRAITCTVEGRERRSEFLAEQWTRPKNPARNAKSQSSQGSFARRGESIPGQEEFR